MGTTLAAEGRKKSGAKTASTIIEAERRVADEVTSNRQAEILEYLKLFGYEPSRTILQVHMEGFFNKRQSDHKAVEQREKAVRIWRYDFYRCRQDARSVDNGSSTQAKE